MSSNTDKFKVIGTTVLITKQVRCVPLSMIDYVSRHQSSSRCDWLFGCSSADVSVKFTTMYLFISSQHLQQSFVLISRVWWRANFQYLRNENLHKWLRIVFGKFSFLFNINWGFLEETSLGGKHCRSRPSNIDSRKSWIILSLYHHKAG